MKTNQLSEYEQDEWEKLKTFTGRPLTQFGAEAGQKVLDGAAFVGKQVDHALETHPKSREVLEKGKSAATSAARAIKSGATKAADLVPDGAGAWAGHALDSAQRTAARIARAGLSPARIVSKHRKRGHEVRRLGDLGRLDLEQIDLVRGRGASWYYPAAAALSGAGAGLAISGGQLVVVASAGAAAAPSIGVVAGAIAADAAFVLSASSRVVGHIALHYGYDPEDPAEKMFILSTINLGTAVSASAKAAALSDLSRLTQALVRGKSWEVLNQHLVAQVSAKATAKLTTRQLTKQGLGKVIPLVGIGIGATMNWATLERIVDAADLAYRRRFLIEKYPHLEVEGAVEVIGEHDDGAAEGDPVISIFDELPKPEDGEKL